MPNLSIQNNSHGCITATLFHTRCIYGSLITFLKKLERRKKKKKNCIKNEIYWNNKKHNVKKKSLETTKTKHTYYEWIRQLFLIMNRLMTRTKHAKKNFDDCRSTSKWLTLMKNSTACKIILHKNNEKKKSSSSFQN